MRGVGVGALPAETRRSAGCQVPQSRSAHVALGKAARRLTEQHDRVGSMAVTTHDASQGDVAGARSTMRWMPPSLTALGLVPR